MSTDLIALVVASALGMVVIVVGLRRNLSETTRSGLPRFGDDPERSTATLGLYEGEERPRHPLSRREWLWLVPLCLLVALTQAVSAVLSVDDRLLHLIASVLLALGAGFTLSRRSARPTDGSAT